MDRKRLRLIAYIVIVLCIIVTTFSVVRVFREVTNLDTEIPQEHVPEYMYGICIDSMNVSTSEIGAGESISTIFNRIGISPANIDLLVQRSKGVFDLRNIRKGNTYNLLTTKDSLAIPLYFIYEHNVKEYVVFSFQDSLHVKKDIKPITIERRRLETSIKSSMWNAIADSGVSYHLSEKLENVFQWTVDFYGVQEGDSFNVIYDEEIIEGKSVGVGTIYGAWFENGGKRFYAIRYEQNGETGYWDDNGKSMKKAFLKAPLSFSRISSRFTASRMHPVLRIRRPHYGVDYAAPSGTPVRAVASGTVIFKSYSGGGGNTIKIRHRDGYMSGYLHLKGYAKGVAVGKSVQQGQEIGYVGSTGVSTGPHLDFRIWKNGKPIDPLKISQEPGLPIAKKYIDEYNKTKDKIIRELEGAPYEPELDSIKLLMDSIAPMTPITKVK